MNRTRPLLSGSLFLAIIAPGCDPKPAVDAPATPQAEAEKEVTKADVFKTPAPRESSHDPRVAEAASAGDAVAQSLAVIHQRLQDLEKAYDTKARTEEDLAAVTGRMKPLLAAARADCDAILRATKDLRTQLPYAQAGYASAATSYRVRAEGYRDPDLRALTVRLADQFDRHAADVPRRLALTDAFIKQLEEAQGFLSETDRCLRDTATALAVFSAGRREPGVSAEGRTFRKRLEQFMAVVAEYQEKLFDRAPSGTTRPAPPAAPRPKDEAAEADRDSAAEAVAPRLPVKLVPVPPMASSPVLAEAASPSLQVDWLSAFVAARADDPLPIGTHLSGEVTTPALRFRTRVSLRVLGRSEDGFTGVMIYGANGAVGRRGVRGRITGDGRRATISSEWSEGNVSPEPVRYELTLDGATLSGTWRTASLRGTIRLSPIHQ